MKKKRAIVIYDGSNFYHKLKWLDYPHPGRFDYGKFSQWLTRSSKLVDNYYAIGQVEAKPGNTKATAMMAKQQALLSRLAGYKFTIRLGYLLRSGGVFHEKGVDVYLALDLVRGAYRNLYDQAYLVSSDSDLVPAVKEVRELGKQVIYVGFSGQISFALYQVCSRSIILKKHDLLEFIGEEKKDKRV